MKTFDLSACATAITVAMVSNIRSGDDYSRFKNLATEEGYDSVSDWISKNAVSQSISLACALNDARVEVPELFTQGLPRVEVNPPKTAASVGKSVSTAESVPSAPKTSPSATSASVPTAPGVGLVTESMDMKSAEAVKGPDLPLIEPDAAAVFGGKSAESAAVPVPPPVLDTVSIAPEQVATDAPLVPAPPAAESASTTSTSTTTESASSVELDSEGLPWDGRIHSSSKKKLVENGRWKLKRNLDPVLVEGVKAELREVMQAPAAPATPTPPVVPVAEQMGNVAPAATTGTPAAPAASSPTSSPITTFAQLMSAITANKITHETINAVLVGLGVPSMPVLATRQDLIPQVAAALGL